MATLAGKVVIITGGSKGIGKATALGLCIFPKAVPHLRPGASIILVSTTLCHTSTVNPRYLLYLTTKGAVEQMVHVLAEDLGPKEITVNAVAPGPTDTALSSNGMSAPVLAAVKNLIPRGRLGTPEEIAEVMAFFSSPASGWMSGQILRVNGGDGLEISMRACFVE